MKRRSVSLAAALREVADQLAPFRFCETVVLEQVRKRLRASTANDPSQARVLAQLDVELDWRLAA